MTFVSVADLSAVLPCFLDDAIQSTKHLSTVHVKVMDILLIHFAMFGVNIIGTVDIDFLIFPDTCSRLFLLVFSSQTFSR